MAFLDSSQNFLQDRTIRFFSNLGYFACTWDFSKKGRQNSEKWQKWRLYDVIMTSKINFKKNVMAFLDSSQNFLQDRHIQFLLVPSWKPKGLIESVLSMRPCLRASIRALQIISENVPMILLLFFIVRIHMGSIVTEPLFWTKSLFPHSRAFYRMKKAYLVISKKNA